MGRALVRNPQVFLFDEPLSNLDAKLRVDMRTEIKRLHQRMGTTIVYVTHDQIEAMTLASQIAVLKDGTLQQFGSPAEIYNSPANIFVADFMGSPAMNLIPAKLEKSAGALAVTMARGEQDALRVEIKKAPNGLSKLIGRGDRFRHKAGSAYRRRQRRPERAAALGRRLPDRGRGTGGLRHFRGDAARRQANHRAAQSGRQREAGPDRKTRVQSRQSGVLRQIERREDFLRRQR